MNIHRLFFTLALLLVCSCSKPEHGQIAGGGNHGAQVPQVEQHPFTQEEIDRAVYLPGTVVVKLTSEAADALSHGTKAGIPTLVSKEIGMTGFRRLFPDAGEYEPRHREFGLHQYYVVDFDRSVSLLKAVNALQPVGGVLSVSRRHRSSRCFVPDDARYSYMWEYSGDYGINLENSWGYTTGDPSVTVCVVDGGVDVNHEDLAWNCTGDHKSFVNGGSQITPDSHGTHVAGTVAGVRNNALGMAGIAGGDYVKGKRGVSILSAEVFVGNQSGDFETAIVWGADHGAVISQNSWGNEYDIDNDGKISQRELEIARNDRIEDVTAKAIDYFIRYAGCDVNGNQLEGSPMKGGVVVFAAGNDGIEYGVPASYEPVIAVGSTGQRGKLSYFSNYGAWVDICAPGENIYSCVPNGYDYMNGTSMACPHVSGSLALLLSQFGGKGFTNEDLEEILFAGVKKDFINNMGKPMGPYLDVTASMKYGLEKYGRTHNDPPVIATEYTGDFKFFQWENVSIPFVISDPDGDNVSVESEISGRATFIPDPSQGDVYRFELMCELVRDFAPEKVRITASDMFGGVTVKEFEYQVIKNRAPEVSGTLEGVLMPEKGEAKVNIDGLFTDPDGEKLAYSASVSTPGIIKASVNGEMLTLKRLQGNGLVTVTITAKDYMGEKVSAELPVLVRDASVPVDFFPNPVTDFLNIRTGSTSPVDVRVRIFSKAGSSLYDGTLACGAFEYGRVDMTGYAPGEYRLCLSISDADYNYVIVKR